MFASRSTRLWLSPAWAWLMVLPVAIAPVSPVLAQTVTPPVSSPSLEPPATTGEPTTPTGTTGLLSLAGGKRLIEEGNRAIDAQDYAAAQERYQQARQIFNQLSNFHQQLSGSFTAIDAAVAQEQRRNALESAQQRDVATYQLALVHRARGKAELAVPLLVQIVGSQGPTRDMGQKAYQQLVELGFIRSNTPRPQTSAEPSTTGGPTVTSAPSLLSLAGGMTLLESGQQALNARDYTLAEQRYQQARQIFNQLSNFHQQIAGAFSVIDNRVAQEQRRSAIESAQQRDVATYQLALVHRGQNRSELAVPLLVQVIGSQSPTRELGKQAYQQLIEMGLISASRPSTPATPGAAPSPGAATAPPATPDPTTAAPTPGSVPTSAAPLTPR